MAVGETDPPIPSALAAIEMSDVGDDTSVHLDKAVEGTADNMYPHGLQLVLVAGAPVLSVFLIALDQTILGTAIPKITDEFHGIQDVSWYPAAYFMTFGATMTSAGKLYKYNNLKWSFLISMLIFELGSLLCAVAPSSKVLIVGRAIAGLGGSGLSVGGTSIITLTVPPEKRPMMMGIIGTTYALAAVLGPLIGGAFSNYVTWRWCFYINLPVGGAAALAVFFFFHLPAAGAPPQMAWTKKLLHMDPIGVALIMGSITCFILGLQYGGNSYPWHSSVVIGLVVGFALLAIVLVCWEAWLGDYSMMQLKLYKERSLPTAAAYQFFFMGSYDVLLYYLPLYFQALRGASPIQSGVDNLPLVLSAAVFALAGGAVVMKTGRAQQVMLVGSFLTTVAVGLIYTFNSDTTTAKWIGYQLFVGASIAFSIMHGLTIAQANVAPEDLAAVTSTVLFFQTIGGAFSTAAGQSAFVNRLLATLTKTAPGVDADLVLFTGASDLHTVLSSDVLPGVLQAYMVGLKAAFAVSIGFAGAAFLSSLAIPMRKLPTHTAEKDPAVVAVA